MGIGFNEIINDILTVGVFTEFQPQASLGDPGHRVALIGTKIAAGSVAEGVPTLITSEDQGIAYFGKGSMLDWMIYRFKRANPDVEVWAVALDEAGGSTAATSTVTFGGTATAAGTIPLYVGGELVQVPVDEGDDGAAIAAAAETAATAATRLQATGSAALAVLTLTARVKGTCGNSIDVRVAHRQDEFLPPGVTVAIVAMSGGATDPDVATALTAIENTHFHTIVSGYNDSSNLGKIDTHLTTRWGAMVAQEGVAFTGHNSTTGTTKATSLTAAKALVDALNTAFICVTPSGLCPHPFWEFAASIAALDAKMTELDVNRPRQTMRIPELLAPKMEQQWGRTDRQTLLESGAATYTSNTGAMYVERLVTTYKTNAQAIPDTSFRDVLVVRALSYIRFSLRGEMGLTYPQHKLARDSFVIPAGAKVARPKDVRALIIGLAAGDWTAKTLVQDLEGFKAGLEVEIHNDDPSTGRVNAKLPIELIKALRVFANRVDFK